MPAVLDLSDKVVVVIGSQGRLGRAFCAGIAAAGGSAVGADLATAHTSVEVETRSAGAAASESFPLDMRDQRQLISLIDELHSRFGRIDAVVNSSYPRVGHVHGSPLDADIDEVVISLGSHQGGFYLVMREFTRYFLSQGSGNIVNLASIYGVSAPQFELYEDTDLVMPVDYAANKHGIVGLTRYFAQYFRKSGVRVNALAPGGIYASQPESFVYRYESMCGIRGMLREEDVVGALIFLLSDASVAITGQVLVVDDGWSL